MKEQVVTPLDHSLIDSGLYVMTDLLWRHLFMANLLMVAKWSKNFQELCVEWGSTNTSWHIDCSLCKKFPRIHRV